MKNEKNYNIGLDIGVGSVGWCVTDENNNILKRNNKNMWGSRIFNEAQTAKERRNFRGTRRRLNRRRERINFLQSFMIEDIEKEYPNFIPMLRESANISDDKKIADSINGVKYNLFSELEMTDSIYYKKFPTIYHLRNYLINTTEKVDIRLVYLAIHHIIKYRGNFLYEGEFSENTNQVSNKLEKVYNFLLDNYDISLNVTKEKVIQTLSDKNLSKSNKKELLITYFDYEKNEKSIITNMINSFIGYSFDLNKIFETEFEKSKISFESDIENEEEIIGMLGNEAIVYENMKAIYSWYILQDILKGKTYISEAFLEKYDKFSKDLKLLKRAYRKYFETEYSDMFRNEGKNNFVAYMGKSSKGNFKKCKPEDFFNILKKKIQTMPDNSEEKNSILEDIENETFLRKINITENGEIPHQLHKRELIRILENQSKYYKTLNENKENIVKLFEFRIPYYVGPLSKEKGNWSWVIRKKEGKIRPWNFEEIVDEDTTAEEFIKRMTNKCTYIVNEDVMPKQSILYSKFCILNELNNIRINERHIAKDMKKKIINELFEVKKKVTAKDIKELYKLNGFNVNSINGLSDGNTFNSNMSAYIDMKKILGEVTDENLNECENIIYWVTIFEDKKILKRKIKNEYPELTDSQIKTIIKLKYTGWSRISKKLLVGLKDNLGDNIMTKLEKTSMNFMQIINKKEFGYDKQLEELMPKSSNKVNYKDIDEIPTSPANKRAIWQTVCVVKEIKKIMKKDPKNIYIEFARSEEQNKRMKDTRAKQLLKKYEMIEKQLIELKDYNYNVYKELKQHQSDKELTEKMFLYFIQNGKCLYSGQKLDIDELNKYEVDHIIPQSYKKDDSIDNKALVIKKENQRKKDNLLLSDEIISNRSKWWKSLLDAGLISQTKFYKLIKRKMFETDEDREKFVQRQLVETRQITKYVTNILSNQYNNSSIYAIRSELTHGFRMKYNLYKNRNINNYHHAQDAYILNVIGNILDKNWHGTMEFKYNEYMKNYFKDEKNKKEKYGMMIGFINKYVDVDAVKKVMNYKDCYVSRMLEEETGAFYNQTLYSPKDKPVISLKNGKTPEKYGGYSGEIKGYFAIFEYINNKNKREAQLIGVPVQKAYEIRMGKDKLEDYIKATYLSDGKYSNFKIIKDKIMKNQQYLDENNELMRFCSDTEIRSDKELIVSEKMNELIYLMNMDPTKLDDNQKETVESGYEYMFDYLTDKLRKEYKIFNSVLQKLENRKEKFNSLENENKKSVINGLINLMETGQGNLKAIGLTEREGRKSGQKFKLERLAGMIFIDKSVTGMYERRYKIKWGGEQL